MRFRLVLRAIVVPVAVASFALTAFATTAAASSKRVPVPTPPDTTFTGYCSFPLFVHVIANKEYETITSGPDASTIIKIDGNLVQSLTNVDSGKTVTLNSSGPGVITVFADGSQSIDSEGPSLAFWGPQAQSTFGLSPVENMAGHAQFTFDANGNLTNFSFTGHAVNECAVLG